MPDYPTFAQVVPGTLRPLIDDMTVDQATDGGVRARAFFTAPKNRLTLVHKLTPPEVDTLLAFYLANRLTVVGFTVQWQPECGGPIYTCIFESVPTIDYANPLSIATVNLRTL